MRASLKNQNCFITSLFSPPWDRCVQGGGRYFPKPRPAAGRWYFQVSPFQTPCSPIQPAHSLPSYHKISSHHIWGRLHEQKERENIFSSQKSWWCVVPVSIWVLLLSRTICSWQHVCCRFTSSSSSSWSSSWTTVVATIIFISYSLLPCNSAYCLLSKDRKTIIHKVVFTHISRFSSSFNLTIT